MTNISRRVLALALVVFALAFAGAESQSDELPAFRKRILGVYDERTGDAIVGADILEFYESSGSAPAEFASSAGSCGVLLLWTRER